MAKKKQTVKPKTVVHARVGGRKFRGHLERTKGGPKLVFILNTDAKTDGVDDGAARIELTLQEKAALKRAELAMKKSR